MSRALTFVRLDFITVKTYITLKFLLIVFVLGGIFLATSSGSITGTSYIMMFAALLVSYPFSIGEKSNMDALYTTLSIRRNTVVLGRYLFALIVDACGAAIAFIFSFVANTVLGQPFHVQGSLLALLFIFLLFSLLQAIQLPLFFKYGYTKGRLLTFLPVLGFPAATILFQMANDDASIMAWLMGLLGWASAHMAVTVVIAFAVWFAIVFLSYRVSVANYTKREF